MKIRIAFTRLDGGCSIITGESQGKETREEARARIVARNQEAGVIPAGATLVDDPTLPQDRHYRDAWRIAGRNVETDIAAARIVARQRLRDKREEKWRDYDTEVTKALASGDTAAAANAERERQRLRDVTKDVRLNAVDEAALRTAEAEILGEI